MRFASARAILTLIIGSILPALQNWLLAGTTRLSAGFDDRQTPIGTMRSIISFSPLRLPIKDKPPRPRWPRRQASSWNRPSQSAGIAKGRLRTMQSTWRNANDSTRECASRGYRRADVGRGEDAQTRCLGSTMTGYALDNSWDRAKRRWRDWKSISIRLRNGG